MSYAANGDAALGAPSAPPLPPLPPPPLGHPNGYSASQIPPISALLLQEAEAWRALLSLHTLASTSAREAARDDATLQAEMDTEQREAAYIQALAGLLQNCDALATETLKLRSFRRARRSIETRCIAEVVRTHVAETLALGQALATNAGLNLSAVTAEVRAAAIEQRNQVSQLRALLEALGAASSLPLAAGSTLVIGVRTDAAPPVFQSLDDFMKSVFQHDRAVNDTSIADALGRMLVSESEPAPAAAVRFARRAARPAPSDAP